MSTLVFRLSKRMIFSKVGSIASVMLQKELKDLGLVLCLTCLLFSVQF